MKKIMMICLALSSLAAAQQTSTQQTGAQVVEKVRIVPAAPASPTAATTAAPQAVMTSERNPFWQAGRAALAITGTVRMYPSSLTASYADSVSAFDVGMEYEQVLSGPHAVAVDVNASMSPLAFAGAGLSYRYRAASDYSGGYLGARVGYDSSRPNLQAVAGYDMPVGNIGASWSDQIFLGIEGRAGYAFGVSAGLTYGARLKLGVRF